MNIVTEILYRFGIPSLKNKTCYLRDKDELIKIAKERCLLPSGDYKFVISNGAKRCLCKLGKEEELERVLQVDGCHHFDKRVFFSLISHCKIRQSFNCDGNTGDVLMKTNDGYKVFDFTKGTVTTYLDKSRSNDMCDAYQYFAKYFRTPLISIKDNVIVEKIIYSSKTVESDNIHKYCQMLKDLIKFYEKIDLSERGSIEDTRQYIEKYGNAEEVELFNRIDAVCQFRDKLPVVVAPIDLWESNIILDEKGEQYYIDFDWLRPIQAFQTIIYFCCKEGNTKILFSQNAEILQCLDTIFKVLGLIFDRNKMKDYFYRELLLFLEKGIYCSQVRERDHSCVSAVSRAFDLVKKM